MRRSFSIVNSTVSGKWRRVTPPAIKPGRYLMDSETEHGFIVSVISCEFSKSSVLVTTFSDVSNKVQCHDFGNYEVSTREGLIKTEIEGCRERRSPCTYYRGPAYFLDKEEFQAMTQPKWGEFMRSFNRQPDEFIRFADSDKKKVVRGFRDWLKQKGYS